VIFEASATMGWILTGLLVAAAAFAFRYQRRKRTTTPRSHHVILLDDFPAVHLPIEMDREAAEMAAKDLYWAYLKAWGICKEIYGNDPGPPGIANIGCHSDSLGGKHPHVLWLAPTDRIHIRVQPGWLYWFAAELHNVFRYQLHGIKHIYETVDDADRTMALEAQRRIAKAFDYQGHR
jgi:hypothetical protein